MRKNAAVCCAFSLSENSRTPYRTPYTMLKNTVQTSASVFVHVAYLRNNGYNDIMQSYRDDAIGKDVYRILSHMLIEKIAPRGDVYKGYILCHR